MCIVCLLITGCSQPGQSGIEVQPPTQTEQVTPTPTVQQTSGQQGYSVYATYQELNKNIILTYQGGPGADKLLFCTVSVKGVEQSKKLGNAPGDTITLEGVASMTLDYVVVIGHFNDGSSHYVDLFPDNWVSGGTIPPYPQPSVPTIQPNNPAPTFYPTIVPYHTIQAPYPAITLSTPPPIQPVITYMKPIVTYYHSPY